MKRDGIVYTVFFAFSVSFFSVLILGFAHQSTRETVRMHEELGMKRAVLASFGVSGLSDSEVNDAFAAQISVREVDGREIYFSERNGVMYFGKKFSGRGLWGPITGVITVNTDVSEIYGFEILSHNETPGLGARIEEKWFLDQILNEKIGHSGIALNRKGTGSGDYDKTNSSIDAVTGATQTSLFLSTIINSEIKILRKIAGEIK